MRRYPDYRIHCESATGSGKETCSTRNGAHTRKSESLLAWRGWKFQIESLSFFDSALDRPHNLAVIPGERVDLCGRKGYGLLGGARRRQKIEINVRFRIPNHLTERKLRAQAVIATRMKTKLGSAHLR